MNGIQIKEEQNNKETNINVVVRIRPRNQKEIIENSHTIVTSPTPRSSSVHVKQGSSEHASKVYTFDKVFGPEVGQETIFNDVVEPMINEVLEGYNCTIFAYGQTGAGKTHTMEGDLTGGEEEGMIPRTLNSLFQVLERDVTEFSVKVSVCLPINNPVINNKVFGIIQ